MSPLAYVKVLKSRERETINPEELVNSSLRFNSDKDLFAKKNAN